MRKHRQTPNFLYNKTFTGNNEYSNIWVSCMETLKNVRYTMSNGAAHAVIKRISQYEAS